MKIEFEIPEEEIQKVLKTAMMQQVNKRMNNYVRSTIGAHWVQEKINNTIKEEIKKGIAPLVEHHLKDWEKHRPAVMEAAERAIINRTSRMIKKLEEV